MNILGIETSCDETALSIIDARGTPKSGIEIQVLADKTLSQIELHKKYGGVFPNVAKREHNRNLIPLLKTVLQEATRQDSRFKIKDLSKKKSDDLLSTFNFNLSTILEREPELLKQFLECIPTREKPELDAIAVTVGPGLEPCLWTGVNFAKALSLVWNIPIVPVNHMEGHIFSALLRRKDMTTVDYSLLTINFPAIALLISGGHTELVLIKNWFDYEIIGQTRDDAVGEAFDKVARLLGLSYPGGPEISRLAEGARNAVRNSSFLKGGGESPSRRILNPSPPNFSEKVRRELPLGKGELSQSHITLPRPMINSGDFDFSFSGLKTAVLYFLREKYPRSSATSPIRVHPRLRMQVAREFEDAVTDVLIAKTKKAIIQCDAKALLIGGGVIANTHIRRAFERVANTYGRRYLPRDDFLLIPEPQLTTDNALMIAVAGYLRYSRKNGSTKARIENIVPKGNLRLDEK